MKKALNTKYTKHDKNKCDTPMLCLCFRLQDCLHRDSVWVTHGLHDFHAWMSSEEQQSEHLLMAKVGASTGPQNVANPT